jgi:hypothetical protein
LQQVVRISEGMHRKGDPIAKDALEGVAATVERGVDVVDDDAAGADGFGEKVHGSELGSLFGNRKRNNPVGFGHFFGVVAFN